MPCRPSPGDGADHVADPRSCTPTKATTLLAAGRPCGHAGSSARRGQDSSQHLGRHRWVIERTLAWLNRFRRLRVRYERRADIHQAFLTLGCVLICHNHLQRFC